MSLNISLFELIGLRSDADDDKVNRSAHACIATFPSKDAIPPRLHTALVVLADLAYLRGYRALLAAHDKRDGLTIEPEDLSIMRSIANVVGFRLTNAPDARDRFYVETPVTLLTHAEGDEIVMFDREVFEGLRDSLQALGGPIGGDSKGWAFWQFDARWALSLTLQAHGPSSPRITISLNAGHQDWDGARYVLEAILAFIRNHPAPAALLEDNTSPLRRLFNSDVVSLMTLRDARLSKATWLRTPLNPLGFISDVTAEESAIRFSGTKRFYNFRANNCALSFNCAGSESGFIDCRFEDCVILGDVDGPTSAEVSSGAATRYSCDGKMRASEVGPNGQIFGVWYLTLMTHRQAYVALPETAHRRSMIA